MAGAAGGCRAQTHPGFNVPVLTQALSTITYRVGTGGTVTRRRTRPTGPALVPRVPPSPGAVPDSTTLHRVLRTQSWRDRSRLRLSPSSTMPGRSRSGRSPDRPIHSRIPTRTRRGLRPTVRGKSGRCRRKTC